MIRITKRTFDALPCGETLEIIADAEADVTALGTDVIDDGFMQIKPAPGSIAIVAAEGLPPYMLNASKVWVKVA